MSSPPPWPVVERPPWPLSLIVESATLNAPSIAPIPRPVFCVIVDPSTEMLPNDTRMPVPVLGPSVEPTSPMLDPWLSSPLSSTDPVAASLPDTVAPVRTTSPLKRSAAPSVLSPPVIVRSPTVTCAALSSWSSTRSSGQVCAIVEPFPFTVSASTPV